MPSIQQLADLIKGGLTESSPTASISAFTALAIAVAKDLGVAWFIDSGVTNCQAANIVRGSVLGRISRGVEVAALAAQRGYLLPDNPLPRLDEINRTRQLFAPVSGVPPTEGAALVAATSDLVRVADAYDAGRITFDRPRPAAQLASFEVSVDGIAAQSGDALVDLLGYQPDADFIKRRRALDSLAKLDFSKRKTYLLFTADVITGGKRENGTILAWIRMRDASGYSIAKRDVFAGVDFPAAVLSNDTLAQTTERLLADNDFAQILSFYDWVHPGDVFAFVDSSVPSPDTVYSYSVSGVQLRAPSSPHIFDVPMSALYLTTAQAESVRALVQADMLSKFGGDVLQSTVVSPYPALAQVVYGDPGYSWILAGCNVLASKRRGDRIEETRALSYVGSRVDDVLAAVSAGRLSAPNDVNQIHDAIDSSIAAYGVSQTILSTLDGLGVTMFVPGKDDPLGFQPTQEALERGTGGLARIIAAIDPVTATLDPGVLASSLAAGSTTNVRARYASVQVPGGGRVAQPQGDGTVTPVPSVPSIAEAVGTEVIDLTTYDGIARFVRLLRVIYDFYPGALS